MDSFAENQGSRVFHLMMILPAGFLLLLLSLISLSTLAHTNNEFLDKYEENEPNGDANCIFYAESEDNRLNFQGVADERSGCAWGRRRAAGPVRRSRSCEWAVVIDCQCERSFRKR